MTPTYAATTIFLVLVTGPRVAEGQAPSVVQCDGAPRQRRDCTAELDLVQQRFAPLKRQLATAVARDPSLARHQDALASLELRRQQLCHDWNACSLDETRHRGTISWIEHELGILSQRLSSGADAEALQEWATQLNVHAIAVDMARGAALGRGDVTPPRPRATPAILQSLARLRRVAADLDRLRQVLPRIGRAVSIPERDEAPRVCRARSAVGRDLRTLADGDNALVSSDARNVLQPIDRLCGSFERWLQPDENARSSVRRFFTRLDRIDGWMTDIDRCAGDYDRRCRNAFGDQGNAAEPREVRSLMREVRRVLAGVPDRRPFPCRAAIWERIENSEWTLSVARAQVPSVGQRARALCERWHVDAEHVNELVQRIDNRVELLVARTRERIQNHQDSIRRLRTTFVMPEGQ